MQVRFVLLAAALATATVSCTQGEDLALDRAAREYDCPRNKMKVRWLSSGRGLGEVFRVDGCGVVATYVCNEYSEECTKESDDRRPE